MFAMPFYSILLAFVSAVLLLTLIVTALVSYLYGSVRIGQGEIEYGRIISLLERYRYDRVLTVDIRDIPDADFAMEPEVRKLKYLLESQV